MLLYNFDQSLLQNNLSSIKKHKYNVPVMLHNLYKGTLGSLFYKAEN